MGRLHDLYEFEGQSPWLDNLKRAWLESGEIQQWIDLRVSRRVDFRPHSHAELRSTEPKPLAARPAPIIPSQETSP